MAAAPTSDGRATQRLAVQTAEGGVAFTVRLTPRSSRDAVAGISETAEGPALAVRVRAVPEKGRANTALCALIATWLGVPKSSVRLVGGAKSRLKRIAVAGEPGELEGRIEALLEEL